MKVKNQNHKILEYLHLSFNKWPSIKYKFWVSLVLWNHNNGEHCWLGNGPEDDHWHPPQRGSQRVITERGGCSRSAVSKHIKYMQSWLEGRNWVGKCAQASLRILSSKADSNTRESFTRSELKLESVHQESPRSDVFRKWATKPLQKQKHRQKHLTLAKKRKRTGLLISGPKSVLFSD